MKRHELTDEQWALVEPLLHVSTARTGRPPSDERNSTASSGFFPLGRPARSARTLQTLADGVRSPPQLVKFKGEKIQRGHRSLN